MPIERMGQPEKPADSLLLIWGEDEFVVKENAAQCYHKWCDEVGGTDHEIVDGTVANSAEALKAVARLREGIQTLPFFGTGKVIWLRNCNFIGNDRTAGSRDVTESLLSLTHEFPKLQDFGVRLLISAGKVDRRKAFYKAIQSQGNVELHSGLSADDRDWQSKAESIARNLFRTARLDITEEALATFVAAVGPHSRNLHQEFEKVSLYVTGRQRVEVEDVEAMIAPHKLAKAFALADALGDRDLPKLLNRLDEEFWSMKWNSQKSAIGLLYSLITKVRWMLFLQEMLREKWIRPGGSYASFKSQLQGVPTDRLPTDNRFNPMATNTFVLYKALPQASRYRQAELVRAMDLLLSCNHALISSSSDSKLVLQKTLTQILLMPSPSARQLGRNIASRELDAFARPGQ